MARECVALCLVVAVCPGCSLILDFSDRPAPIDVAIDTVYTAAECAYKEPNDTGGTAAVIVASDMGPAAICASGSVGIDDHDFYRFTVPAGSTTTTVSIAFTNRPGGDLDLRLYAADDVANPISQSRGFGDGETITCPAAAPSCPALTAGDYVFEVFPGLSGAVNDYTFSVVTQ